MSKHNHDLYETLKAAREGKKFPIVRDGKVRMHVLASLQFLILLPIMQVVLAPVDVFACGDMAYLEAFFGSSGVCLLCDILAEERGKCFVLHRAQAGDTFNSLAALSDLPVWLLQRINGHTGLPPAGQPHHALHSDFNLQVGEAHTLQRNGLVFTGVDPAALSDPSLQIPEGTVVRCVAFCLC
jgi:hypothetical protein